MARYQLKDFTGIIPALLTPFDRNGQYDPACSREMVDWLIGRGVGGFYLTGSTGQGPFMDSAERMAVVESMTRLVNGRVPVVAHIGAVSSRLSARMAAHAAACGCDAVSAVPSYYYTLTADEMRTYYEAISDASPLPLVIYALEHQYKSSVKIVRDLAGIEHVEGIKYTGTTHYMMGRIKEHMGPDFMVYSGTDEMMLSGQIMGVDGAIGSTYNVVPDLNIAARDAFWRGDVRLAQKLMLAANAILEIMFRYTLSPAIRAGLEFIGVPAGLDPSPVPALDTAAKAALRAELRELALRLEITGVALLDAVR